MLGNNGYEVLVKETKRDEDGFKKVKFNSKRFTELRQARSLNNKMIELLEGITNEELEVIIITETGKIVSKRIIGGSNE